MGGSLWLGRPAVVRLTAHSGTQVPAPGALLLIKLPAWKAEDGPILGSLLLSWEI